MSTTTLNLIIWVLVFLIIPGIQPGVAFLVKVKAARVEFFTGLIDKEAVQEFIISPAMVAREMIYREHNEPHRVVMGTDMGSFDFLHCFKIFQQNREQQVLFISFNDMDILDRALNDYLPHMNVDWVFAYFTVFRSPIGKAPRPRQRLHEIKARLRRFPSRIRIVLGFPDEEYPADEVTSTDGLTRASINKIYNIIRSSNVLRRKVAAIQLEAVHASHTEYLLNCSGITTTHNLILRAPPSELLNTTKINIDRLSRLAKTLDPDQILYDMNPELRDRILNPPNDDLEHVDMVDVDSGGVMWTGGIWTSLTVIIALAAATDL